MQKATNHKSSPKFFILAIVIGIGLLVLLFGGLFLYYLSGFGKCELGEALYFKGTRSETCAKIGTKVDPIPTSVRTLTIVESPWTGWSEIQPDDIRWVETINREDYEISLDGGNYKLKVIEYNDEEIRLSVNDLALKQGETLQNTGSDLTGCKYHEFVMRLNEKVELDTCTLDAGINWEISYD